MTPEQDEAWWAEFLRRGIAERPDIDPGKLREAVANLRAAWRSLTAAIDVNKACR